MYLRTAKRQKKYFCYFSVFFLFLLPTKRPRPNVHCFLFPEFRFKGVRKLETSDTVEMKDFIYYPTYNSSYTQLVSKNNARGICFYTSAVGREYSRFVHMKNTYCTPRKGIGKDGYLIWTNHNIFNTTIPTLCSYKHILFLYSSWGDVFGHWLQDCMPALVCIPQEIINKSMIMVSVKFNTAVQWLAPFGIDKSRIISDKRYWYFAENLYLYYQLESNHGSTIHSMQKLIRVLRDKFKVNGIKGTKYVFSNKEKFERRSVSNFQDLFNQTIQRFPQYKWELQKWDYNHVSKLALEVASIKVLVSPSGSKCYYSIFMNHDLSCGIMMIMNKYVDYPNFGLGITLNIWQMAITHLNRSHWAKWNPCNISYSLTCIDRVLYAVKHKCWPKGTFNDMREAFDLNKIFKTAKEHPGRIVEIRAYSCLHGIEHKQAIEYYKDNYSVYQ